MARLDSLGLYSREPERPRRKRRAELGIESLEGRELMAAAAFDPASASSQGPDAAEVSIPTAIASAARNAATALADSFGPLLRDLALTIALPRFTPAQRTAVDRLVTDVSRIGKRSGVPSDQLNRLRTSAIAALASASSSTIDRAALDAFNQIVQGALADGRLAPAERTRLGDGLRTVLRSAQVPDAQADQFVSDARAVLDQSRFARRDLIVIRNDVRNLVNAFSV